MDLEKPKYWSQVRAMLDKDAPVSAEVSDFRWGRLCRQHDEARGFAFGYESSINSEATFNDAQPFADAYGWHLALVETDRVVRRLSLPEAWQRFQAGTL